MCSASNNNDKTTATVCWNVSGTKYEVSRSLIEQYPEMMLARLISEEWDQEKAGEDLFIDRNWKRFEFVLDYMRDQKVSLPTNDVSKYALLQELEYFGFNDFSLNSIDTTLASLSAALHMDVLRETYMKRIRASACIKIAYQANMARLTVDSGSFNIELEKNKLGWEELHVVSALWECKRQQLPVWTNIWKSLACAL